MSFVQFQKCLAPSLLEGWCSQHGHVGEIHGCGVYLDVVGEKTSEVVYVSVKKNNR